MSGTKLSVILILCCILGVTLMSMGESVKTIGHGSSTVAVKSGVVKGSGAKKHHSPLPSTPPDVSFKSYRELARIDAQKAGIDQNIFERQIQAESGFNPSVVSPAGAIGVAQFMPSTAAGLGINPYNPIASLWAAAKMMRSYVDGYGSYAMALAAYNSGPGKTNYCINTYGSDWFSCLYPETQRYINLILA